MRGGRRQDAYAGNVRADARPAERAAPLHDGGERPSYRGAARTCRLNLTPGVCGLTSGKLVLTKRGRNVDKPFSTRVNYQPLIGISVSPSCDPVPLTRESIATLSRDVK